MHTQCAHNICLSWMGHSNGIVSLDLAHLYLDPFLGMPKKGAISVPKLTGAVPYFCPSVLPALLEGLKDTSGGGGGGESSFTASYNLDL